MSAKSPVNGDRADPVDVDMDEDEDDLIDDEQLDEYREMVENLGTFPDKVKINSLSMVADDHAESRQNAAAIYNVIRELLISPKVPGDRKLPLVYVVDSILKNVKGMYVPVIEADASSWLPVVYQSLTEEKRAKLKKVYNLWKNAGVFSEASWKKMGASFTAVAESSGQHTDPKLETAGIVYGKDGRLLLMPKLRQAMQTILDDLQSDVEDELEKVSLERVASIDPDLLVKIKRTAEDSLRHGGSAVIGSPSKAASSTEEKLAFLVDTRTPESIERSLAWGKVKIDYMKESHDMIAALRHVVMDVSKSDETYTQKEAIDMTNTLGAAGAMASLLTNALERIRDDEKKASSSALSGASGNKRKTSGPGARGFFAIDKSLFTSDGLKKKNMAVIGLLYEIGLPFVSSTDGKRFASQLELSNHLDSLFKKNQLEKTMARTEERGWYVSDSVWSGELKENEETNTADETTDASGVGASDGDADPSTFTMPADESRDRCVICGINFKMFFDNDDGIYMYSNCREIEVLNDEAAAKETEDVLVHVTCWRALGSPEILTADQTLQDSLQ